MKYALITGASRGLGKAIALRLAKDGFTVIINYQSNKEAAEDTLKQVQEAGGTGELLPFNVADPQAIETALESWATSHPDDYISVLVNNAGIVNAIAPGFIATDMTKELENDELKKLIPLGRFGKPEEVAALAAFLASDDAAYITGQVISINGGLYT